MKLNIEKCKVMHFGKHNTRHKYTIDSYTTNTPIPLATSEVERHLGIQLKVYLKVSHQCKTAANRANFQLIVLKSKLVSRDAELWKKLYITYIRPHLEYAVVAWNPCLFQDISILEKLQERATKVSPCLQSKDYKTRCNVLGLTTLNQRIVKSVFIFSITGYPISGTFSEIH